MSAQRISLLMIFAYFVGYWMRGMVQRIEEMARYYRFKRLIEALHELDRAKGDEDGR